MDNLIDTIGALLKSVLGGARDIIFNLYSNKYIIYLVLFIASMILAFLLLKKFISMGKMLFTKNYIIWYLVVSLLIFLLLAFL